MKISYKGDYALKAVFELALNYNNGLMTGRDLAKRINAPEKFLEQVLLELKKCGFIESRRGKVGGYILSRPPAEITVGQVVRNIDGPIEPIACLKDGYNNCTEMRGCVFKKLWHNVSNAISGIVDSTTFENLINDARVNSEELTYSI